MNRKYEIIAETAFSHEGDVEYLNNQIHAAKKADADYVKFQIMLEKNDYYCKNHPSAKNIEKWMIAKNDWLEALTLSKYLGLKVVALPLNIPSLEFCLQHDQMVDMYEVHSVCLNETPLLEMLSTQNKTIIFGVGGRLEAEIDYAKEVLQLTEDKMVLMFGFQSFPTNEKKLNLNKIKTYSEKYRCRMGYADHSTYDSERFYDLNAFAYLMGTRLFEKHIVLEKGTPRIDYESAVGIKEFNIMRKRIAEIEEIVGSGDINRLNYEETVYRQRQKILVYTQDIKAGTILTKENVGYRICNDESELEQKDIVHLLGMKINKDCYKDQIVSFAHIQK